jgi:hypothetical protein
MGKTLQVPEMSDQFTRLYAGWSDEDWSFVRRPGSGTSAPRRFGLHCVHLGEESWTQEGSDVSALQEPWSSVSVLPPSGAEIQQQGTATDRLSAASRMWYP